MRKIAAYFISFYQSRISPHKGFKCAHKGLYSGESCSEYIKQQILHKGIISSVKDIRQRFRECREAAQAIQKSNQKYQRGDCDIGVFACDACDFGGSSSSVTNGCLHSCDLFHFDSKNRKRDLWILVGVILVLILLAYYFVGRKVESVDIRLKEKIEETSDQSLSKLFNTQLPDYKINFVLDDGKATTYTLKNVSAKDWINLKSRASFYVNDIQRMTIVDKELTRSKELESFISPEKSGEGKQFEFKINHRWQF